MTNTTAKKFNMECKNGLRVLSESFGFDYNKPFECFEVNGRFTNNKILKKFEDSGYTPTDSRIFAAVKRTGCFHDFVIVRLCTGGGFAIKNELRRWMVHGDKRADIAASELWAKYDYEDLRKDDTCHAYFFAQKREDPNSPYPFAAVPTLKTRVRPDTQAIIPLQLYLLLDPLLQSYLLFLSAQSTQCGRSSLC